ncbi:MAG: acyl-CoA/acyl-ACP dehydrogenase [Thermotogae bacterium]|nr:acyl-CoA/acyl-ACP dehydrogenase [Thermotogota bacterium]
MEVLKEFAEILGFYDEIVQREIIPVLGELDGKDRFADTLAKLAGLGVFSEEINDLPVPVRVKAIFKLASGDGGVALCVGTRLAFLEYGLPNVGFVRDGRLAQGSYERYYHDGLLGEFVGKEVEVLGMRGIGWIWGEFRGQETVENRPNRRILLYDLTTLVGMGWGALREAERYAKERKAFGRYIYEYGEVRRFIEEGRSKLLAAESLLLAGGDLPSAVYQVVDAATYATEKAVQIFGGYGYINEYPVSRYMRDVRMLRSLVLKDVAGGEKV